MIHSGTEASQRVEKHSGSWVCHRVIVPETQVSSETQCQVSSIYSCTTAIRLTVAEADGEKKWEEPRECEGAAVCTDW